MSYVVLLCSCWLACFLWYRTARNWQRLYEQAAKGKKEAVDGWRDALTQGEEFLGKWVEALKQRDDALVIIAKLRDQRDDADWWKEGGEQP